MSKTALIVDDSKSARLVLKRLLETHALDVDTAESAELALDYLNDHRPDVIFMDHMMPGMDGFEAVSAIKNNPQTATIPIMMYTSQKGEVYVGQARALGAVGVLPKEVEPVEVSKMLASLRVIDEHVDAAEILPQPRSGGDSAEHYGLEHIDNNIRILIEDLFDQQRAILRRDLLDSYESIAARVADEMRVPADDPPNKQAVVNDRLPTQYQVATVVLGVLVLIFAWLYWEREQRWLAVRQQNEDLLSALEQQQSIDAQGAVEVQQRLDSYQRSLGDTYGAALGAIEWGINQTAIYEFGDIPLGDNRLPAFEALLAQLLELGFSGQIQIESRVGDFCLTMSANDTYVLAAADIAVSQCDLLGFESTEAAEFGQRQSVAFANFINTVEQQTAGQLRFELVSLGNSAPLVSYPVVESGLTAAEWNSVAVLNNRVNVSLLPDR